MALVTKRIMNAFPRGQKQCNISCSFHSGRAAVLVAKVGTIQSASVYRGERANHMRSEAFKDKARLQLHSKNFGLKQLCNNCKMLYL